MLDPRNKADGRTKRDNLTIQSVFYASRVLPNGNSPEKPTKQISLRAMNLLVTPTVLTISVRSHSSFKPRDDPAPRLPPEMTRSKAVSISTKAKGEIAKDEPKATVSEGKHVLEQRGSRHGCKKDISTEEEEAEHSGPPRGTRNKPPKDPGHGNEPLLKDPWTKEQTPPRESRPGRRPQAPRAPHSDDDNGDFPNLRAWNPHPRAEELALFATSLFSGLEPE
ncbi:hypothetical protein MBM_08680 [Drepanopeziza brunnea f. sp. 'multigermtubi' MB_m1]|uniref:Uncharacterized protein n=1 Tax=Marssonina brunnea f. sp. multigermtubi (strain MB_m1) TaxID=1072389 RepID=K1WLT5_MARBU|nr:uncharacterized protein MBM_08680 [Drepanopeziza brunnea f. sp. 'multigermtubi' MB_m1]EKD13237.1 hypothetical protein MBM_08680 [Drepanopeziza brunnea f. sp. 'multigermtubi' MB_m1]